MQTAVLQNSTHSTEKSGGGEPLSPAQLRVVQQLAQGVTVSAAAQAVGVHRTTVYHWFEHNPRFAAAVKEASDDYGRQLEDELASLAQTALATLRRLLENPETPPNVQLRAAIQVLARPHFEHRDWNLPDPHLLPDVSEDAAPGAELRERSRHVEEQVDLLLSDVKEHLKLQRETGEGVPRNGPCPCGSRLKYKRCCGRDAPPVLGPPGAP